MKCENCNSEMHSTVLKRHIVTWCCRCYNFEITDNPCDHEFIVVDFEIAGGRHQYCHVCKKCSKKETGSLSQAKYKPVVKRNLEDFYKKVNEDRKPEDDKVSAMRESFIQGKRRLVSEDYNKYILSEEWKIIRRRILIRDNFTCKICKGEAVDVHHLTYAHFKNELDFELISLCRNCHTEEYHSEKSSKITESVKIQKSYLGSSEPLT